MVLVKKLTRIGNSWGVILPTEVLKVTGFDPHGACDIEVKKDFVLLRPHNKKNKQDEKVMTAMARFIRKYRDDLKRLA
jgi:antitoxin component of MazEF toxin-antitoxin module